MLCFHCGADILFPCLRSSWCSFNYWNPSYAFHLENCCDLFSFPYLDKPIPKYHLTIVNYNKH